MDDVETTLSGSAFQILATAARNARLYRWLTVLKRQIAAAQSVRQHDKLAGRVSGPRYCHTPPGRILYACTVIWHRIRLGTHNQFSRTRAMKILCYF